jgi:uncharacterized protein (DUF488 family)
VNAPALEVWATNVEYGDVGTTVYTSGYEQHATAESLAKALKHAGIERLVDVRQLPLSRRRGFSKTALAECLAKKQIEYVHVRELGNPKPYRDLYRSGRVNEGKRAYRKHLRGGSQNALADLADALRETTTCLLCVEHSHEVCHRSVIVEALLDRLPRLRVVHLA